MPKLKPRSKPANLTVRDNLSRLLVVKLGRKSTPDPRNPGKSVDDQLVQVDLHCARHNLIERIRIEEDRQGASQWSKRTERKKFEEAMAIIETEDIAVFAVWSLSRSARRLMTHGRMAEILERRNTLIMVEGRLYDCSEPQDRVSLGFQALMDENQVAVGRRDTMRGLASAAKLGLPHGPHLYGYQRIYDQKTAALERIDIVDAEAAIIREIADRIINGESQRSIAADLTARGVQRPRGAKAWYPQEVRDTVTNIAYTGKRSHTLWRTDTTRVYEAIWEPILEESLFEQVRAKLDANTNGSTFRKSAKYLLTGIVRCGNCDDGPMYANRSGGLNKPREQMPMCYHCPSCRRQRNMGYVETYVLDVVGQWIADPSVVRQFASAVSGHDPKLQRDRAELAAAEEELEKAYSSRLSARGLQAMESQWLPVIERLKEAVQQAERVGQPNGWTDLAAGRLIPSIPKDIAEGRTYLSRLIRVRILPQRRGVGFRPEGVQIVPLGAETF